MNPYPQYMFNPNPQGYLSYNQNAYQQYPVQKAAPTIEEMYTTVHPYNNQQFLLRTFGNKSQYIKVFLTLSHQDKLKMYMLMEENKLYGYMTDKDSYQRILKEIAQKVHNYNLFYQKPVQKQNKDQEKKTKDLENKIDLIVEKTFEKLNLSNVNMQLAEKKTDKEQLVLSQDDNQQEQWIESSQSEPIPQVQPKINSSPKIPSNKSIEKNKQHQVFNMFTFDSNIQEALTHNIGLKTVAELQKKSIWQLQLEDYQLMGNEPDLKEVFGINQSQKSLQVKKEQTTLQSQTLYSLSNNNDVLTYENYQNQTAQSQQISTFPINSYELYHLKNQGNNNKLQFKEENQNNIPSNIQIQDNKENINNQSLQQTPKIDPKTENLYLGLQYMQNKIEDVSNSTNQQQNENFIGNSHQNGEKQQNQKTTNVIQSFGGEDLLNNDFDIINNQNFGQALTSSSNYQTVPQKQINSDFDLFGVFSTQRQPIQPKVQYIENYHTSQSLQNKYFSETSSNFSMPNQSETIQQPKQPEIQKVDVLRQTLFQHDENKEQIIRDLKIQLNPKDKQLIVKLLKNKSFECSTDFYLAIINYLREVSLEWSPQYNHFNQQYKIVKQILEQSQRYTRAVDQDEQDKVQRSVKKTKQLLNIIYNNSNLTQQYAKNILEENNKEKGLLFKFGRILINSAISTDSLSKAISETNKKQVFTSFFTLFIVQKLSSIQKIKLNSQKFIANLQQQYQKHRNLNEQMITQIQLNIQAYPKYLIYIRGLLKLCILCQRMISLLKICCIKTQSNMVKTLKICKDVKTKYSDFLDEMKDSVNSLEMFEESIKSGIERNKSVYQLHSDFFENYKTQPICGICLRLIQKKGSQIDNIYYHYSCFNLVSHLEKNSLPSNQ